MEGTILGLILVEGILPGRVEVNSISQDEHRCWTEDASRDQVFDLFFCLVTNPVINGEAGLFQFVDKVERS